MRLDKMLANSGYGTRSEVRGMISRGQVLVNGNIVKRPEHQVSEEDEVSLDGKVITSSEYLYYLLDKPDEVLTAMEDPRLHNVGEFIPDSLRGRKLAPVGRLDYHTTGLLIITNDGTLSHRLQSPRYKIRKVYLADYTGPDWTSEQISEVGRGLTLTDTDTPTLLSPAEVRPSDTGRAYITLTEGKTHEVRRIFAHYGREVTALRRISLGDLNITEETADCGLLRELTSDEISGLKRLTGL